MTNILIVENDTDFGKQITDFLYREFPNINTRIETNIEDAIASLKHGLNTFKICIIDIRLPVSVEFPDERPDGGLEILNFISENNIKTSPLVITAYGNSYLAKEAIKKGAVDYIEKSEGWKYIIKRKIQGILEEEKITTIKNIVSNKKYWQIFVSYVRIDYEKAAKLYQKLEDTGYKPWMDTEDILPGEKWKHRTRDAIKKSDIFLVCLTANSINKRGMIQKEIRIALNICKEMLDSDIYLIPVRLEECEVPESLQQFQCVDLFEKDGWGLLLQAIHEGMKRRQQ